MAFYDGFRRFSVSIEACGSDQTKAIEYFAQQLVSELFGIQDYVLNTKIPISQYMNFWVSAGTGYYDTTFGFRVATRYNYDFKSDLSGNLLKLDGNYILDCNRWYQGEGYLIWDNVMYYKGFTYGAISSTSDYRMIDVFGNSLSSSRVVSLSNSSMIVMYPYYFPQNGTIAEGVYCASSMTDRTMGRIGGKKFIYNKGLLFVLEG